MFGFAEGTFVGTEVGDIVGAAVGSAEGATDGLPVVGWDEVGIYVVGFAEGAFVATEEGDFVVGNMGGVVAYRGRGEEDRSDGQSLRVGHW